MSVTYNDDKALYFREMLSIWGRQNLRNFPWRKTLNPFHILLAEMMLRRTNAPQVVPVYISVISLYPEPKTFVEASPSEIYDILRPLGLTWRAENIRQMVEILVQKFNGAVPDKLDELLELPGVGDYVASAVCSFAFNKSVPIIDTNTVRVAGRFFGFETHAESRRRKSVRETIRAITDKENPRIYNYSFLDFAAIICKATKPECFACPLLTHCNYGQKQLAKL